MPAPRTAERFTGSAIFFELFDSGSSHAWLEGTASGLLAIPLDWDEQSFPLF